MIYTVPCLPAVVWFGPSPPPFPLSCQQDAVFPDPYSLNQDLDPDPACCWIRIWSGSGSSLRFIKTKVFLIKNRICPHKPIQKDVPTLQKWNFLIFFLFGDRFWPVWIRIRLAHPDSDHLTQLNLDTIRNSGKFSLFLDLPAVSLSPVELTGGRGGEGGGRGEGPYDRKKAWSSIILYKSFNALCLCLTWSTSAHFIVWNATPFFPYKLMFEIHFSNSCWLYGKPQAYCLELECELRVTSQVFSYTAEG